MNLIIEMGGTKINFFVIGESAHAIKFSVPTADPEDFKDYLVTKFKGQTIKKLILACFGPISLDAHNYGEILNTPKQNWRHVNIYDWLKQRVCRDTVLVTDVSLPAIGAIKKYQLQGSFFSYITVGTGIGGCNIYKGTILQNELHPEIGHMYLGDLEESYCGYHSHCFESQASGHYFSSKHGLQISEVDFNHPGRLELIDKLATLIYNLYAALGVDYVILGGGATRNDMKDQLINRLQRINNSYLPGLNAKDINRRLILNENSSELSMLGGMRLLDGLI